MAGEQHALAWPAGGRLQAAAPQRRPSNAPLPADSPCLQRKLLAPTRWEHGDVALMCLATAQL